MADASSIGHVTQSMRNILRASITDSGPFAGTQIELKSPKEIVEAATGQSAVSLWLYRVNRLDDFHGIRAAPRFDGRVQQDPLPLVLHYLVTPFANDNLTRHRLMGFAMQALYDQPHIGPQFLQPELMDESQGPYSVHLEPHSLDEALRLWQAIGTPIELSASYLVQYLPIDSKISMIDAPPVVDRTGRYTKIEELV
jgi:Pvc16 N-terminal domain